ncbi:MAG TPA: cytochrome c peroxidase [Burkholderiaceae bacterium]
MRLLPPAYVLAALAALAIASAPGRAPAWQADAAAPPAHLTAPYAPRPGRPPPGVEQLTELGRAMFFDKTLSGNGRVACASCHDPAFAFGPPDGASVQPGANRRASALAVRATPSLRYLQSLSAFTEHHFDNDGDDSIDMGPTGGRMWDGRAGSAHEQARLPLLSPAEMGNADEAAVVRKLARAPYAAKMREAFGPEVFADTAQAFAAATLALEVFQQSPRDFYPYSSRYDAVLRGQATLTPREARGLALFNDPAKGNCASCHLSATTPDGAFPLFTDFGHIAIGVPRNEGLRANDDPRFFDLGLCGPLRTDFNGKPEAADYCGRFRTPGLRNVALRKAFFHNGVVHTLEEAVRFYATRDTDPAHWYGRDRRGQPRRFDDLPARYHGNVNTEPPFGGKAGGPPALNETEIGDIVEFLKTLTDADLLPPR